MSVVLRCPTCGTTQTHAGECEACSEGDVRYFCTSHDPGLWLTEPRCSACGAKFGDAPTVRPPSPARATPTRPRVAPRAESRSTPRATELPGSIPTRPRPTVVEPEEGDAEPSLAEVLVDMLEEGRRARGTVDDPPWREPIATAPPKPFIAGCLGRLLLLVFLLIALALAGLSSLFGVVLY